MSMTKQIPTPTLMGGTISAGPKMPGMGAKGKSPPTTTCTSCGKAPKAIPTPKSM